jgi:hypothetical protein
MVGWDVVLDGSHQSFDLQLAEASYPEWGVDVITRDEALSVATALLIDLHPVEPKDRGGALADQRDVGRIRIDRIVFTP